MALHSQREEKMGTQNPDLDEDVAEISLLFEELYSSNKISIEEKIERLSSLLSVITEIKATSK